MIRDQPIFVQSLLGTLFTWALTAAGAALVFCFSTTQYKILDGSLGFAAGVMLAASYWSLLQPAIDIATDSGEYGSNGEFVFIPVAVGFFMGAVFVFITDFYLPCWEGATKLILDGSFPSPDARKNQEGGRRKSDIESDDCDLRFYDQYSTNSVHRRFPNALERERAEGELPTQNLMDVRWRKILLLIIAITVHNIPEGLAVGVGFGAVGRTKSATFESARNLALGIGIQNFPEGLAVSLPLHGAGMSKWRSFWFGQLSGLVEPVFGVVGCLAITLAQPILPYALSFAAGAMIYVVVDDIIPEARAHSNGKLASWSTMIGFIVMMILDVGLDS